MKHRLVLELKVIKWKVEVSVVLKSGKSQAHFMPVIMMIEGGLRLHEITQVSLLYIINP
jgi:hypothetical protein